MPEDNQLSEKLNELKAEVEQKNKEVQDLINKQNLLIKNHRHQGLESVPIETLIKNAKYVDGKIFRAGGTSPVADGTYSFHSVAGTVATMTTKAGIITAITLS